ncbi:MAG: Nif3-like dinuclear metal center hexameric protein [Deltaproteobacteria bacterium]|nr:Nif3-like dinuclear metal center hexameric protein [Deltaproteobacteria bacterium]
MSGTTRELVDWLDVLLEVERIKDSALNGLQVEGRPEVRRVVTGVSANRALIQAAIERKADLVVVHHGLFWGNTVPISGPLRQRLKLLLEHEMTLAAYHLPLDLHPALGNNAGLCKLLGLVEREPFGLYKGQRIGFRGQLARPTPLAELVELIRHDLHPDPIVLAGHERPVSTVAVCSGGAPELVDEAIACGCDLYLSGELTEYTPAMATEGAIDVVVAGHHATERSGVRSLATVIAQQFNVIAEFVDVANKF